MLELGSLEADAMPTICRGFQKCISQKIEKEMQYPGQVKVTVIREIRAVSFAK